MASAEFELPEHWTSLGDAFVHQTKKNPHTRAIVDSLGIDLTYQELLTAAISVSENISHLVETAACVGVMLPPSSAAVVINIALTLLGKIPVNLNYTSGQHNLDKSIHDCGILVVITSKTLTTRMNIEVAAITLEVEHIVNELTLFNKAKSWVEACLFPENILDNMLPGLAKVTHVGFNQVRCQIERTAEGIRRIESPATVIFTSGSTADPKGVVLSHRNLLSNIEAIKRQGQVGRGQVVLGVVPFFHSFGLMMTLWAPLCLGETVVYHYDPLDARRIAGLCEDYDVTTVVSTPTLMSQYLQRAPLRQFRSVKQCVLGGEKLKHLQLIKIGSALGITPLEGYGLAETSPVVACNVEAYVKAKTGQTVFGTKCGTVGLPVPGTSIRIDDPDTGASISTGRSGLIVVKGPQVMLGYLNNPEATAKCIDDGWFKTGDVGSVDEDGFLTIVGRLSQFSKIAGEMVPHLAVEEEIVRLGGGASNEVAVVGIPDEQRGEKLVVLYSRLRNSPEETVKLLRHSGIPNLWIPNANDFYEIPQIPILPNGKVDLKGLQNEALRRSSLGKSLERSRT